MSNHLRHTSRTEPYQGVSRSIEATDAKDQILGRVRKPREMRFRVHDSKQQRHPDVKQPTFLTIGALIIAGPTLADGPAISGDADPAMLTWIMCFTGVRRIGCHHVP